MVSEQFYEIFKYQPDIRNIIFEHQKIMIAQDAKKILDNMEKNMVILKKFVGQYDMKIQEFNRCYKFQGFEFYPKFSKKHCIKIMADLRKWSIEIEKYILPIFDTAKYDLHITDIIKFIDYDNQLWSKANHDPNFCGPIYDRRVQWSGTEWSNVPTETHLSYHNLFWTNTYKRLCIKYKLEYDIFHIDYHDNSMQSDSTKNIKHIEFNEGNNITVYETDLDYFMEYITDNNLTDKIIVRKINNYSFSDDFDNFDIEPLYNMLEYGYDSRYKIYSHSLRLKKFERNIIFKNKSYKYFEYLVTSRDDPYKAIASIVQTDFKLSDREKKWYE